MMDHIASFVADPVATNSTLLFGAIFFTFMFMFFLIVGATGLANRRAEIRNRILLDRVVQAGGGGARAGVGGDVPLAALPERGRRRDAARRCRARSQVRREGKREDPSFSAS